jgi:hypothetical protein
MAAAGSAATASTLAAFQAMGKEFGIEDTMIQWLTSPTGLGARNMDDFLHAASNEQEVAMLAEIAEPNNVILTTSRLRQAWCSLQRTRNNAGIIRQRQLWRAPMDIQDNGSSKADPTFQATGQPPATSENLANLKDSSSSASPTRPRVCRKDELRHPEGAHTWAEALKDGTILCR